MPAAAPLQLPRRAVLAGGVAGLAGTLTACSAGSPTSSAAADPAAHAAAARGLRRRALRASDGLLARYTATATAHPDLAELLAPLRETVAAHLRELRELGDEPDPPAAAPPEVPSQPERALQALVDAERETAGERGRAVREAPPDVARLLASLAAAGAVQVYLLGQAGDGTRATEDGAADDGAGSAS